MLKVEVITISIRIDHFAVYSTKNSDLDLFSVYLFRITSEANVDFGSKCDFYVNKVETEHNDE